MRPVKSGLRGLGVRAIIVTRPLYSPLQSTDVSTAQFLKSIQLNHAQQNKKKTVRCEPIVKSQT